VASSLRSFRRTDAPAVLELSRRALTRPEEQVGNPIWETLDELESELGDWEVAPEETLVVDDEDGRVVGLGGVEISPGWEHADLFGPLVSPQYRGQKLGSKLLDASLDLARRHDARVLVGSVGAHNIGIRMLLEGAGFHARGGARAVFRMEQADHRPLEEGPEGVEVRRGTPADLQAVLELYDACFPDGAFPDEAWRKALELGTVWLAGGHGRPLAFLNIDPSDRWAYQIGVVEGERDRGLGRYLFSVAVEDYWREHPGEILGLAVETDNLPSLRMLRRQGFAPWLMLQPYELVLS
jgi:ribosomal protein S18 acetylase RimI-like enzyme